MPPTVVLTVSEINAHIKALFLEDDLLTDVWLSGEVSNFKQASSGHCYFTLKDNGSCLRAVMWRTQAALARLPREGDAIVAHGYVSVYEPRGDYQFYVDEIQLGGVGWLWQEFQRLKERLDGEGLFDPARKRPLASLPCRVGVVTSASGAALRDILRTLASRCPLVEVILSPCLVQGDEAPDGICAAIAALNQWSAGHERLDAIVVARGGGSIEELWAFNDERVARAIAGSRVPIVSGVGHETDFTIADFVADLRAPTPTGAAAAIVPDVRELTQQVTVLSARSHSQMANRLAGARGELASLAGRLARLSPERRLARDRQRVDEISRRAGQAIDHRLKLWRGLVQGQQLFLSGINPAAVLTRGYAIVSRSDGSIVTSRSQVVADDAITVRVADGTFDAKVTSRAAGQTCANASSSTSERPL